MYYLCLKKPCTYNDFCMCEKVHKLEAPVFHVPLIYIQKLASRSGQYYFKVARSANHEIFKLKITSHATSSVAGEKVLAHGDIT